MIGATAKLVQSLRPHLPGGRPHGTDRLDNLLCDHRLDIGSGVGGRMPVLVGPVRECLRVGGPAGVGSL